MNKKEMKSAETKAKLGQAFITLYQEKPIEKISVREITDAAGYNRATFYIYYKDIYDLLESIESRLLRYAEKNLATLIEDALGEADGRISRKTDFLSFGFLKVIRDFYHGNESEFSTLMVRDIHFLNSVKELMKQSIMKDQNNMIQDVSDEIEYVIEYQLSAVCGVLNAWISKGRNITFEALSSLIFRITTSGAIPTVLDKLDSSQDNPLEPDR